MKPHGERKHSKFSASASERWFNCQGSVALNETVPSRESVWSREGTQAHEVLELLLTSAINGYDKILKVDRPVNAEMINYGTHARDFIFELYQKNPKSEILIETRIHLPFIHPEMFGTFDGAVVDHFGTLHVFDYKYGAGHAVSPTRNLQMIFYGIGLAAKYDWNFQRVRLWIIQPRIRGYDGPTFWELEMPELLQYTEQFKKAVKRVEDNPNNFVEGSWCHWCSAKSICPLKRKTRLEQAQMSFASLPLNP